MNFSIDKMYIKYFVQILDMCTSLFWFLQSFCWFCSKCPAAKNICARQNARTNIMKHSKELNVCRLDFHCDLLWLTKNGTKYSYSLHFHKTWNFSFSSIFLVTWTLLPRATPRAYNFGVHQYVPLNKTILFDCLIMFVALELIEIRLYEVTIQINTFKIGDGLIFGYVLRRP